MSKVDTLGCGAGTVVLTVTPSPRPGTRVGVGPPTGQHRPPVAASGRPIRLPVATVTLVEVSVEVRRLRRRYTLWVLRPVVVPVCGRGSGRDGLGLLGVGLPDVVVTAYLYRKQVARPVRGPWTCDPGREAPRDPVLDTVDTTRCLPRSPDDVDVVTPRHFTSQDPGRDLTYLVL